MPNRLLLLLGFNPIFTEPSYKYDVFGFWAKKREDVAAGHLHLFTLRTLVKLLELNQLGDILIFTCADIIFPQDLLKKIIDKFEKDPQLIALSGPGVPYDAPLKGSLLYAVYNIFRFLLSKLPKKLQCFSTSTNFLAVRRTAFEKTGGFDPEDINADGLMGRKLLKMGKVKFSLDTFVYISARRMKKMGFIKFVLHYLYILENFFPSLSHTKLIKNRKMISKSQHRKLHNSELRL
jgi:hypothetical protein